MADVSGLFFRLYDITILAILHRFPCMNPLDATQVVPFRPSRKLVVQHNALAEARYRLSVRAQKLLIRLLAELDQRDDDFTEIKLYLRDFAKLASGDPGDVLFAEFIDTAKQFMGQFVSITQSPVPGEKLPRGLICHWISSLEKNPNERSITFSFDPKLRPYLLGLSRNFFAFHTLHAFNLDSAYSIRLYQWAKSRQFLRRPQQVSVADLRHFLGTMEIDGDGVITKESLKRYNDFKKVALQPAVREINRKTDIALSFQELRQPGTKIICAIVFSIALKEGAEPVVLEAEFRAQPELPLQSPALEASIDEEAKIVQYIKNAYQLNNEQVRKVQGYIVQNGMRYVLDKIAVTECQPRDNTARFFLAALRDDYKMPVRHIPAKRIRPKSVPLPEPEISEEERRISVEQLREWRLKLVGNPGIRAEGAQPA
jgi:plasmid replication initiation protein